MLDKVCWIECVGQSVLDGVCWTECVGLSVLYLCGIQRLSCND